MNWRVLVGKVCATLMFMLAGITLSQCLFFQEWQDIAGVIGAFMLMVAGWVLAEVAIKLQFNSDNKTKGESE